ncbi:MAG: PDZ domain-containing protein [Nitrospirae bacterium]|nr:PDZ domain-containing protein [Nitrospirota bacterium]
MKNYFIPFNLLILATGVFFITHIVIFRIAQEIEPPFSKGYSAGPLVTGVKETKSIEMYKAILDRNIFKSKTLAELLAPSSRSSGITKEEKQVVPIRLIGTVAGDDNFAYAIIEDPFQKAHKIFRINDTITPGVRLADISRSRITIERDGQREDVEIASPDAMASQRTASPPAPRPAFPAAPQDTPQQGTMLIEREAVAAATEDMNKLLTQARLVPNFTGGAADGFRIFSIVPGSIFDKAGLRNGDILYGINGTELKDPEKAFQVYQMLKDNDRFVIDLVRAGQKMTLNYEIR